MLAEFFQERTRRIGRQHLQRIRIDLPGRDHSETRQPLVLNDIFPAGFLAEHIGVREAIGFNAALCAIGLSLALLYYVTHRAQIEATSLAAAPSSA